MCNFLLYWNVLNKVKWDVSFLTGLLDVQRRRLHGWDNTRLRERAKIWPRFSSFWYVHTQTGEIQHLKHKKHLNEAVWVGKSHSKEVNLRRRKGGNHWLKLETCPGTHLMVSVYISASIPIQWKKFYQFLMGHNKSYIEETYWIIDR